MRVSALEQDARSYAFWAHRGQTYNDAPYSRHLEHVHQVLLEAGFEGPILAAAFLHDILEDTDTPLTYLTERFGTEVAGLVWAVTGEGVTRRERNAAIYSRLTSVPFAKDLKVADRIANLEARCERLLPMYLREQAGFREAVEGASPALLLRLEAAVRRAQEVPDGD